MWILSKDVVSNFALSLIKCRAGPIYHQAIIYYKPCDLIQMFGKEWTRHDNVICLYNLYDCFDDKIKNKKNPK